MQKILIFLLFFLSFFGSTGASEYINPDGSRVNITIKGNIPDAIHKAVLNEISTYLPTEFDTGSTDSGSMMDPHNWEYIFHVKKLYSDKNMTSIVINMYQYTGGAHGMSARIGLVYDTKNGKKLNLSDLYNTEELVKLLGPIWKKRISTELTKIYESQLEQSDNDWIQEGSDDIDDFSSFTIGSRMITFYGQEYQHNPYAFGARTFSYPLSRLKELKK